MGVLGVRGNRQKLPAPGLAELGDGRPMESGFGILSRPSAAAGSLTFSPNDSRTVRRVDPVSTDRGEYNGGCRCALLNLDPRYSHPLAEGGARSSPSSSAGFGVLPIAGGPDSSSDMGLTIDSGALELARVFQSACSRPDSSLPFLKCDPSRSLRFLYRRNRRNAPTQTAIPAKTVTKTITTILVVRSSDPMPPLLLELAEAVLEGLEELVGVSKIRVNSGVPVLVSVITVADDSPLSDVVRVSGLLVVDVARLVKTSWVSVPVLASFSPGVRGCVSSMVRSAATQRIWIAGPTVTSAPAPVASRAKPQTPPRKSVISVVQVNPTGTQYAAVSPGAMAGNPSSVLVLVTPQLGPTTKPRGQMAGE